MTGMSEKPESDEFEEDEDEAPVSDGADVDLDQVNKELDLAKRRGKLGDPAWRRLERIIEDKRTAELTSDFDDYDIGSDGEDDDADSSSAKRSMR